MSSQILISRPVLTVNERDQKYQCKTQQQGGVKKCIKDACMKYRRCSKEDVWGKITGFIPILDWLPNYKWKDWLLGDTIAGVTIAMIHIPQGMGFALLANIPPICGIYMALFQSLVYSFFATSKHCSMGTFAVITLMTGKLVKELSTLNLNLNSSLVLENNSSLSSLSVESFNKTEEIPEMIGYSPIAVATVVCFMTGVWELIMGVLHVGALSVFLSDMLVSGFATGAAVHVVTSQLKFILGIKPQGYSGPFKLIYTYISIFSVLPTANVPTLIISLVSLTILILNNEVLKPIVSKRTKIPIPIELIVVILGTVASYYGNFEEDYNVKILSTIPTGLPVPTTPPLELMSKVASESLVIAIVSYTITYCQGKIVAEKNDYVVDANQELYAQGFCNLVSSFFACAPSAAALVRTLIQDAVGGVTQLASIICCFLLVFVLLFIGPLFETLPNSVLACIIVVALKGMFLQFNDMFARWKISKSDAAIWIITFLAVVLIDIDYGLLIGFFSALCLLLCRNQTPTIQRLVQIPNTDVYLSDDSYQIFNHEDLYKIINIKGSIHFANKDSIKERILKECSINLKQMDQENTKKNMEEIEFGPTLKEKVTFLILDLSGVSSVDPSGCKFLGRFIKDLKSVNIIVYFSGISESLYQTFNVCGLIEQIPNDHLYHSLHDAVTYIKTNIYVGLK